MGWDGTERRKDNNSYGHHGLLAKLDASPSMRWLVTVVLASIGSLIGVYMSFQLLQHDVVDLKNATETFSEKLDKIEKGMLTNMQFRVAMSKEELPKRVANVETHVQGIQQMMVQFVQMQSEMKEQINGTNQRLDMILLEVSKLGNGGKK